MTTMLKRGLAAVAAAGLLVGGALVTGVADGGRAEPAQAQAGGAQGKDRKPNPRRAEQRRTKLYAGLAEKLGKSEQEVAAAARAVMIDRLDAAVKAGRLTSAQRDAIVKAYDAGLPPFAMGAIVRPGRFGGGGPGAGNRRARPTPAQLLERRNAAFAALGDKLGVSGDAVRKAMRELLAERLDTAVDRGRISRSQADKVLKAFDTGRRPQGLRPGMRRGAPVPAGP